MISTPFGLVRAPVIAVALLVLSTALRLSLVWKGGQYYFPDEQRYNRGANLYLALTWGDLATARTVSTLPDHMLFTWTAAGVTAIHHGLNVLAGHGGWPARPEQIISTIWLGAAVLSVFSALNIALVYRISRILGATAPEALWSMLLMAVAQAAIHHARHLSPYDCALFFALLGLYLGLSASTVWRILFSGVVLGLSYGIYNGYWFLVPVVWFALALRSFQHPRPMLLASAAAVGAVIGVGLPVTYGWILDGSNYLKGMSQFSGTVTQGSFAEGWILPWEYLWHMESWVGIGVMIAIASAIVVGSRNGPLEFRVRLVIVMIVAAYLLLVLLSNGLHIFVVYARTAKPLVPLLCLLGGWALARLLANRRLLQIAVAGVLLTHGTLQFASNLNRIFPREIEVLVTSTWGNPNRAVSFDGPKVETSKDPISRPDLVLVNAQSLNPINGDRGYPPGRVLLRAPHPLSVPAFQYDGADPKERAVLRTSEVSIQLIEVPLPASNPAGAR